MLATVVALGACGPGGAIPPIDGAVVDAGREADAEPPPDALGPDFGTTCTTAADCPDGVCVDGPAGNVCTYGCTGHCPPGWACRVTEIDGVLASLCLPVIINQCTPCTSDDQCPGGACIDLEDGQSYCLPSCFESACPEGYACGDDPSGEHPGGFCIPETGSCSCNADNDGAVRTCENMNGVGTCFGTETCDPDVGWTGCTAPDASVEVCDGADNDCDFLIDDGVGSGSACSNDVVGVGSCPGVALCTGVGGLICQGPIPSAEICDYTDNDCDIGVDEGFSGLGTTCSPGVGGCERFGVVRCDVAGAATECSVTAGPSDDELCNAIDDDCDGPVDEDFTLGGACTAGVGVCQRGGNTICDVAGTGTTCSASAGPMGTETCNTLDDDCDGDTDEGWLNQTTLQYDQNNACGSCAIDCTVIYGLPNASGSCVVSGSPSCVMTCGFNAFNLNAVVADGCEFILDGTAIYVSTSDPGAVDDASCGIGPINTGSFGGFPNHPCKTILQGLTRATGTGRANVLVANGIYTEAVTMVNGKNLRGGYQWDTWVRDVASTGTMITGLSSSGAHDTTVTASGITSATVLDAFVIFGSVNAKVSGNSYAIYASGSNGNLTISNNVIFGGRGGPGGGAISGADGTAGNPGAGRASDPAFFDAKVANAGSGVCDPVNDRASSGGAVLSCGGDDVSGGNGGGNRCRPVSHCICSGSGANPCSSCPIHDEYSGLDGAAGQPGDPGLGGASGGGADAGYDRVLYNSSCYVSSDAADGPSYGLDGPNGASAGAGPGVAGCSAVSGAEVGGHWVASVAAIGNPGGNGGGGGGGGAGAGSTCEVNTATGLISCPNLKDNLGGHGGGGGSGGCGGLGGVGAQAGGGAFGVFVVGSTVGPVITNNRLVRGEGGVGGTGGEGGTAGLGGAGGAGGVAPVAAFCADVAGRGGNGGAGGHGAGGGGGCGGMSQGIYTSGVSGTPNYCGAAGNTIIGGGGGAGGAGGFSLVNSGGAGSAGVLGTCSYN